MSQQIISIGAVANDNTGDTLRDAFTKANDNFTELYVAVAAESYPQVVDHASLPPAAANATKIYIVQTTTGIIGLRKLAGLWRSDGASWIYLGLYGRNASEVVNVPGVGSSAADVQGAINDIGGRTTDGWAEGATNLYFTANRVRDWVLTGLSTVTNAAIAATDTLLGALGKLQAQINALASGKENAGVAAGLLTTHTGAVDPHPQYLTPAEADAVYAIVAHTHVIANVNATASTLLFGRSTAGAGGGEQITLGSGLTLSAGVLSVSAVGAVDSRMPVLDLDFAHTNAVQNDFTIAIIGTGSSFTTAPAAAMLGANHPGVHLWRCGTTANSGVQCFTGQGVFRIGGGEQFDVYFGPAAAFTGTLFRAGAGDQLTSTAFVDGIWFEYNGSGAIVGKTRSNSIESTTATLATLAASTWYHGRITVNAGATSVLFEIFSEAGALLGSASLAANIPTAAGREFGWGAIATNSGVTAADLVHLDRMRLTNPGRTVARGAA